VGGRPADDSRERTDDGGADMTSSKTQADTVTTTGDRAEVGDGLVVPTPPTQHLYRWGRITEVINHDGPLRYRVWWLGDNHDSVVVPPPDARVESAARWPNPGGDAIGLWPHER
jgi:hypothetical protein